MANLTYLVPTKNIKNFNCDYVYKVLLKKFPNLTIGIWPNPDDPHAYISVYNGKFAVTEINFDAHCDLIDYDKDIDELNLKGFDTNNRKMIYLSDELVKLKKLNPDLDKCGLASYRSIHGVEDKSQIEFYLKDIFNLYIFDEGIHPEYIHPDDKRKKSGGFLKSFGKWLLSK